MQIPRTYHSTAILLPDGRVFVGGGGQCGVGCPNNHLDAEILSPPYLFNADGTAATRPVIQSAPTLAQRGSTMQVTTQGAVSSFALMRLSATTHTVNNDQRRVPLSIASVNGTNYTLSIPADPGVVLPGYYMLFALNAQGVPSVATTVQIP
jgi:galactose oxidase